MTMMHKCPPGTPLCETCQAEYDKLMDFLKNNAEATESPAPSGQTDFAGSVTQPSDEVEMLRQTIRTAYCYLKDWLVSEIILNGGFTWITGNRCMAMVGITI
jgi:hypothetical protein